MKKLALATFLACLAPSCASLFTGTTDEIQVTSEPAGAYFRTNFGHFGQTPARIDVPCDQTVEVVYFTEGYLDQNHMLTTRMSSWIWGNIMTVGLGALVDVSGPGYTHVQDFIHADLQEKVVAKHPFEKNAAPDALAGSNSERAPKTAVSLNPEEGETVPELGGQRRHVPSVAKESFEEWESRQKSKAKSKSED